MRFLLSLPFLLLLTGCPPQQFLRQEPVPQLSVRGEATLKVKPDQVEMLLEAVTAAKDADEALAANSAVMATLQESLLALGLNDGDFRTGQFSIQPEWSRPPRPAPANWSPEIVGYQVSNSLQVATARVELAGRLLAVGREAGINRAGQLRFSLADPEEASRAAIAAATARARQRAAILAEAAGVKLGALLEVQVEEPGGMPQPRLMMAEAAGARNPAAVPVVAGEVEVTAAVVLRYALVE